MQPGRARTSSLGVPPLLPARWVGWVAQVRPTHGVWFVVARPSGALGAHVCALSWAAWLLFPGVPVRCVALCVRCPGPLGSCSPVCPLGMLCRVCGVLGHLAPVNLCARSVRCLACAVSWATWLSYTCVLAPCVELCVRCPRPLRSCAPVCSLGVLCCLVCEVPWATWLLYTCVLARCAVLRARCPGPFGSCTPVCSLRALSCVCGVLGLCAPVHLCACSVCCVALCVRCPGPLGSCSPVCSLSVVYWVACAVSWTNWLLFTGVPAPCVASRVGCRGPFGSCSPVCPLGALSCVCGVLGHLAPVHRCARFLRCVACAVSWATWLPFTALLAWCAALRWRCPVPLGFCSPVCSLCVLCCVCFVLGHLATVHPCAHSVCCVALCVRCPEPLGCCSPVCSLRALCCVCNALGHLAPVHQCALPLHCVVCAMPWATWLLFTSVLSRCIVLRVRCPGPLGSCSTVCPLRAVSCVCGVLSHLAPVPRCACSVRCVVCAVF